MIQSGLSAFVAALGFGVIFNIRGIKLIVAALIGGVGGFTYALALSFNVSEAVSLLFGATCMSIAAELASRKFKTPVTTFMVCALIPLVPGGSMYYTMIEVVKGNIYEALVLGTQTIMAAGALALGCTLVSSTTRFYYKMKMKVKNT